MLTAIASYWFGSQLLPDTVAPFAGDWSIVYTDAQWQWVMAVSIWFFFVLPSLYWTWVIKIGKQAKWKLIIALSLSSLVARYTYPAAIAEYFEFITWLRYPIIAVLLILEIYLMVTIIKALWQARSLTGDPRIHMLAKFGSERALEKDSKESKKMELALTLAHEPASWYYAIPRFSRNHVPALANIKLRSASFWHFALMSGTTIAATIGSYLALYQWSELAAALVATFIVYLLIMFVANYRISRHYSLYEYQGKLVVNDAWWGFAVLEKTLIARVETGQWAKDDDKDAIFIGRGNANIRLSFVKPQLVLSAMAMIKDEVEHLYLSVDDPERVVAALSSHSQEMKVA